MYYSTRLSLELRNAVMSTSPCLAFHNSPQRSYISPPLHIFLSTIFLSIHPNPPPTKSRAHRNQKRHTSTKHDGLPISNRRHPPPLHLLPLLMLRSPAHRPPPQRSHLPRASGPPNLTLHLPPRWLPQSPPYLSINPCASLPTLIITTPSGHSTTITQSIAALEYLEDAYPQLQPRLSPVDIEARARVRELVSIIACDIQPVNKHECPKHHHVPRRG